jgi:hypothetical protein
VLVAVFAVPKKKKKIANVFGAPANMLMTFRELGLTPDRLRCAVLLLRWRELTAI